MQGSPKLTTFLKRSAFKIPQGYSLLSSSPLSFPIAAVDSFVAAISLQDPHASTENHRNARISLKFKYLISRTFWPKSRTVLGAGGRKFESCRPDQYLDEIRADRQNTCHSCSFVTLAGERSATRARKRCPFPFARCPRDPSSGNTLRRVLRYGPVRPRIRTFATRRILKTTSSE
jgi:hypothetical protein